MTFIEFKKYLEELSKLEFIERDNEINQSIAQLKGEMSSRGILVSSITLQRLAEFFFSEYEARSSFVKGFIISNIGRLDLSSSSDPVTDSKVIFQSISEEESDKLKSMYEHASAQIRDGLKNDSFKQQIDGAMMKNMEHLLKKNNLYVEFECKISNEIKTSGKNVLLLTPNFYGIGVDLRELWGRIFKT